MTDNDDSAEHDPRYAKTRQMYAVLHWDNGDNVEVVCATKQLADDYIDGQWTDEGYSVKPVTVIEELPERRPLYSYSGKVPYPAGDPKGRLDDFAAEGEFPGLGNGAIVKLDEVKAELSHHLGNWAITVIGWDKEDTAAEYRGLVDAALRERAAVLKAFEPYGDKAVVTVRGDGKHAGKMLVRVRHGGYCYWRDMQGSPHGYIYDNELDPRDFSTLTFGEPAAVTDLADGGTKEQR